MKKAIIVIVTISSLSLSACAGPETRVRNALVDAGLSDKVAACMADRMIDRLSLVQLNKLSGLKKLRDTDARKASIEDVVKRSKALQDPEIVSVVTTSGVICALPI